MRFTPGVVEKKKWNELLGFGFGHERFSLESVRKNFEAVKAYDSGATYNVEGTPESFVLKHHLPQRGENGLTRVVRTPEGYYYASYQERYGESGADKLSRWTRFISELPDQSLLPAAGTRTPQVGVSKR
ncbi:hypothetical protein [Opitutus terrae]|uniref:Uncharacterized protein n=1 Tax=Opitutus terrae (strain DSM 11246 / JCM 15787 / PB90-1) TaxID=452637 RepID=B1ZRD9_OPITP|nr:hypothetical protein [Opitutus terrae]ACB74626.1 hypothetical protein Oter_1341 [Opitutus terrae PB90-1]